MLEVIFKKVSGCLNITDYKQKYAQLLYQVGQETQEIFNTLTEMREDYKIGFTKFLDDNFLPKKNVNYEMSPFLQASHKIDEMVHQFVTQVSSSI